MKLFISRLGISAVVAGSFLLAVSAVSVARPHRVRIITNQGMQIRSVFFGTSPNLKVALAFSRATRAKEVNRGSCSIRKAIYRETDDPARFLNVQGGGCIHHYQVDYFLNCEALCGGGMEDWTYSNALLASYCDGGMIEYTACNNGDCQNDFTCQDPECQ